MLLGGAPLQEFAEFKDEEAVLAVHTEIGSVARQKVFPRLAVGTIGLRAATSRAMVVAFHRRAFLNQGGVSAPAHGVNG